MENFNPFTFDGRIGRLQYFGFAVIWGVILFLLFAIGGGTRGGAALYFVGMVVYAVATVSYGIRRLHDFDKSGWWYLLGFVPFANFVLGLILLLAPGTAGPNTYGVRVR